MGSENAQGTRHERGAGANIVATRAERLCQPERVEGDGLPTRDSRGMTQAFYIWAPAAVSTAIGGVRVSVEPDETIMAMGARRARETL